jgi:hypothetical protein
MVNNSTFAEGKAILKNYLRMIMPKGTPKKGSMMVIVGFILLLIVVISVYLCGWIYQAVLTKIINLQDLLNLLDRLTSPQMLLALSFLATCLIDVDGDGFPDKLEKEAEKKSDEES